MLSERTIVCEPESIDSCCCLTKCISDSLCPPGLLFEMFTHTTQHSTHTHPRTHSSSRGTRTQHANAPTSQSNYTRLKANEIWSLEEHERVSIYDREMTGVRGECCRCKGGGDDGWERQVLVVEVERGMFGLEWGGGEGSVDVEGRGRARSGVVIGMRYLTWTYSTSSFKNSHRHQLHHIQFMYRHKHT